ncbi:hypothetical protein [Corynebacterium macginleyi]|uniref:Uncharacterized protein n=1 Tax=Corynebacterium macginleyi TaxID=38290 RepID=A0ABS1Y6L4_9CORY|nr:hypothetical protein [Corynebacterium macginleyi]MBM0244015.1 hypothetical protein [Corynebacterium macginleyi]QRJ59065.1 hypothetical protein GWO64_007380 [Corynebacterium macginleyi]QRJ61192.1 hypothetical protein GWO70_007180 [Corynebacterium macginleyi]QRP22513.1 hypothetical protein I6J25_07545 [Corynebacterium macginleyi]
MGKFGPAKKNFDQDLKDRVVCLMEDRIAAENMSMQAACKAVVPKSGVMANGYSVDLSPPAAWKAFHNQRLKM